MVKFVLRENSTSIEFGVAWILNTVKSERIGRMSAVHCGSGDAINSEESASKGLYWFRRGL
nr:MAG TPA: hypothetical protein [Bacteriophage sp.]